MSKSYAPTKAACYVGYIVQAIVNNFLPILFIVFQNNYGLSYEELGRIIFINFFVQLFADLATPKIVDLIGYKGSSILCHALAAFGLTLMSVLPSVMSNTYFAIIICVIICAFGSGIIEVCISPMVELLPTKNKAANMAFLHSFYCWGQAITVIGTTVLIKLFGFTYWNFVPLIWAVIPFLNIFAFLKVDVIEPKNEKQTTAKELFKTREFVCFLIFMICAGASEISMAQWASMFAQQGLGVSKVVGDLLGPCAFAILMGSGRIFYGHFSKRFSVRKSLIINNILCIICYVLVGICNIPAVSLIACALCGFTVSLSWPGTYSLAVNRFKNGGTFMFSMFALGGDLGCSVGPWVLGAVADAATLNIGFIACAAFPLIMLLVAVFLLKEKDCKFE